MIRDPDNLVEMEITIDGKGHVFRSPAGSVNKIFQACGVALPPILRPPSKTAGRERRRDTRIFSNR